MPAEGSGQLLGQPRTQARDGLADAVLAAAPRLLCGAGRRTVSQAQRGLDAAPALRARYVQADRAGTRARQPQRCGPHARHAMPCASARCHIHARCLDAPAVAAMLQGWAIGSSASSSVADSSEPRVCWPWFLLGPLSLSSNREPPETTCICAEKESPTPKAIRYMMDRAVEAAYEGFTQRYAPTQPDPTCTQSTLHHPRDGRLFRPWVSTRLILAC